MVGAQADEAAKRKAERDGAQAAERAQRDGAQRAEEGSHGPPQRGWSRRGSRSGHDSLHPARSSSGDGAGPPSGDSTDLIHLYRLHPSFIMRVDPFPHSKDWLFLSMT